MPHSENGPPTELDPYETLQIAQTATAAEVKSAYRKLALLHHPDKVQPSKAEESKQTFQKIVSAYAILSDERRRKRYDTTGNTSESLDLEDSDFNWLDFFRAQWSETVTEASIENYKQKYQGSDEEKQDVLDAYKKWKGNIGAIFASVPLCNELDDEERFRHWIDEAIKAGEVESFKTYHAESARAKQNRRKRARKEAREAEAALKEHKAKGKKADDFGDLASLIQQRQQSRATNFLDDLEAKYAPQPGSSAGGKGRKRKMEEPPEEAFQKNAKKMSNGRDQIPQSSGKRTKVTADEDDDIDLEQASEEEDEEKEDPSPSKTKQKASGRRGGRRAKSRQTG